MTLHRFLRKSGQLGRKGLLGAILLVAMLAAFSSLALAQGNVLSDPPKNYQLVQGWYQNRATYYYDFGANTQATSDGQGVVAAPIYVLVAGFDADGNPQVVEGQHNIVGVIPGDEGYSDLWQVTFVTVPADYVANTIKSVGELMQAGYTQTPTDTYVNCPIVPANSILAEGGNLVQGWYQGQEVYYFDFGQNPPVSAPIYVLVTGFDADGNPQVVEGQHNIVNVIPGDEGYSAFWDVHFVTVPADYQANTITSAADLMSMNYPVKRAGVLVNCPIARTDETAMMGEGGNDEMMMSEGDKSDTMMAEGDTGDTMMAEGDTGDAMMTEGNMAEGQSMGAEAPQSLPATGGTRSNLPLDIIIAVGGALLLGAGFALHRKSGDKITRG